MKQGLTELITILDRSGSMGSIWPDAVGGLKQFVIDQKQLPGEALFTLLAFDTEHELVHDSVPLPKISENRLFGDHQIGPRGSTALLDAIGITFNKVGERLANTAEDQRPEKVMVAIITDGQENSSQEFTKVQIKEMVQRQERDYNWAIIYLGANVDAFDEAGGMGLSCDSALNFGPTAKGIVGAFAACSARAGLLRTAGINAFRAEPLQKTAQELGIDMDTTKNKVKNAFKTKSPGPKA